MPGGRTSESASRIEMTLAPEVLKRRVYNNAVNARLRRETILRELASYIPDNQIAIDVGAATGHITSYLSAHAEEVYSFEAIPPVFKQLQKMEAALGNVHAFNIAISDYSGFDDIYVDHKRLSNSGFQDLVGGPQCRVQVESLDSLFIESLITGPVGFIKIDVEGTELDVLHGAGQLIDTWRPSLMVEIYEPFSKYPVDDIFVHLFGLGYRCFSFAPNKGLIEIPDVAAGVKSVRYDHKDHDGDFLFVGRLP